MAGGGMHPAQVSEAIRALNGGMPSQEIRPGIDEEPPPGWQPPPLPRELEEEIIQGGGSIPPELAGSSGGQVRESPRRLGEADVRTLGPEADVRMRLKDRPPVMVEGHIGPPPAPRAWPIDLGIQGIRVIAGTENGLALILVTDDGELGLIADEADVIMDVCVRAVSRGLEARLAALRARVSSRNPIDTPQEPA